MMRTVVGAFAIMVPGVGVSLLGIYLGLGYEGGLAVGMLLGVAISYLVREVG